MKKVCIAIAMPFACCGCKIKEVLEMGRLKFNNLKNYER